MIRKLVRQIDYLTARVTQRDRYQVVMTFQYANGPLNVASTPTSKRSAIQEWRWRVASGEYAVGTHRSTRVMSVAEARKAGIR